MTKKNTSRVVLIVLAMAIMTTGSTKSEINPWDLTVRIGSIGIAIVVGNWAWYRLKACKADIDAKKNGTKRVIPTFTDDLKNIAATTICAATLVGTALGTTSDTPKALEAIGVEGFIMGANYLLGRHVFGLEEMRLRHAMVLTVGIGGCRELARKGGFEHFSFGAKVKKGK